MPIQQDYTPNLDVDEVCTFLMSAANTYSPDTAKYPHRDGYTLVAETTAKRKTGTPTYPVTLIWAAGNRWRVDGTDRKTTTVQHVLDFRVIVPVEQAVTVTVSCLLHISDTVNDNAQRTKLVDIVESHRELI
jgi:hypothetical protein